MQNIVHDVEKSNFFYSGDPPQIKNPNVVQRDMQIRVALRSSFGPKLIWTATGAPRRPNSEILPRHTVGLTRQEQDSSFDCQNTAVYM